MAVARIRLAGALADALVIEGDHHDCGDLNDDIGVRFAGDGGVGPADRWSGAPWVMSWQDFEAAYLTIKAARAAEEGAAAGDPDDVVVDDAAGSSDECRACLGSGRVAAISELTGEPGTTRCRACDGAGRVVVAPHARSDQKALVDAIKDASNACFYHPKDGWGVQPEAVEALRKGLEDILALDPRGGGRTVAKTRDIANTVLSGFVKPASPHIGSGETCTCGATQSGRSVHEPPCARALHYSCVNCSKSIPETGLCEMCSRAHAAGYQQAKAEKAPNPALDELTWIVSYLAHNDQDANHAWMVRRIRAVQADKDPSSVPGWLETDGVRKPHPVQEAIKVLVDGLKYYEHDGHDMPKKVARDALAVLGVSRKEQP